MTRTFWMRVFGATYWVLVGLFLYIFAIFFLPDMDNPDTTAFLPILVGFLAVFVAVAVAATAWRSAPRRPRFWLVGLLPAALFLLMNAPYLPFALTHPGDVQGFTASLPLVIGTIVVIAAGWLSFREARVGGGSSTPTPRGAMALTIAVAATLGAVGTALLSQGGTSSTAAAVSATALLEARDVTFTQASFSAEPGKSLGLVVVNHDSLAHSFDIDSLNLHVQLPANASTLVAVTPTAAGTLQFYCAVPGHQATMHGTITVP